MSESRKQFDKAGRYVGWAPSLERRRVEFTARTDEFLNAVQAAKEVHTKAYLELHDDKITVRAMNASKTVQMKVDVTSVEYSAGPEDVVIGIDTAELADVASIHDPGATVSVTIREDPGRGDAPIAVTTGNLLSYAATYDPENLGEINEVDEFGQTTTVTLDCKDFKAQVGAVGRTSESKYLLRMDGTATSVACGYSHGEMVESSVMAADVDGPAVSAYFSAYNFRPYVDALPPEGDVELEMGDNTPLSIRSGGIEAHIAPCVPAWGDD